MELKCIGNIFRAIDLGGGVKNLSKQTFHINIICVNIKYVVNPTYLYLLLDSLVSEDLNLLKTQIKQMGKF